MLKKLTATLILSSVLAASLISCASSETSEKTVETSGEAASISETAETEAETTVLYPEYDVDYEGADFNILYYDAVAACGWSDTIPCDINSDEQVGDILGDEIYLRNRKIETLCNIAIKTKSETDNGKVTSALNSQVMSGSTDYDAAFPAMSSIKTLISGNLLASLDGLFDWSSPWFDQNSFDGFRILGKTYAVASDITYMDKLLAIIIMFNKQMTEDYGLGDIYETVVDGEWTLDTMLGMCSQVSADLDGNDSYDKNDRYGFSGQNDATYELYQSAGLKFCTTNESGIPEISINSDLAISVLQDIFDFMNQKDQFFNRQTANLSVAECEQMFISNQVLFFMRPMETLLDLRAMDADFGVIPTPMMYEGQDGYSTSIGYTVAIMTSIPYVVKDIDMSVAVLDTLAAESYYEVNPLLYDVILGSKMVRDDNSTENLDIIFATRVYDPGCIYDFGGISNALFSLWKKGADSVASTITSYEPKINADIDKLVAILEESA